MKIVLAGAFGNLGADILKCLVADGHEIVAADLKEGNVEGTEGKYTFVAIDATNPDAGVSYRTGEFEYDPAKGEIENIDSGEENEGNTEDMRIISEIITDSIAITSGEETQQKTENTEEIS